MGISWSNPEILSCILLLCLGDISAPILSIVDSAGRLPFWFLWKLGNGFNSIANRQKMYEADCLLTDNLHSVDWTELAQIFPQFFLCNIFRQVSQVDISRGTRLLYSQCH